MELLTELCVGGMLLVITNAHKGDFHSDVVGHLLQLVEIVASQSGERRVYCVLPGWEGPLEGPPLGDPCGERVTFQVLPVEEYSGRAAGPR